MRKKGIRKLHQLSGSSEIKISSNRMFCHWHVLAMNCKHHYSWELCPMQASIQVKFSSIESNFPLPNHRLQRWSWIMWSAQKLCSCQSQALPSLSHSYLSFLSRILVFTFNIVLYFNNYNNHCKQCNNYMT